MIRKRHSKAMVMERDDGFVVTLEGHQPTITEQLQLLPFSQNVLCLPPLDLPPPPPPRKYTSPSSPSSSPQNQSPILDSAVRKYILSLHDAHVSRVQKAKRFLSERGKGSGRMVFMNGGFAAVQVACLEALRQSLSWDDDGTEIEENATREAEWLFQDIMHGGVQALQCNPSDGSKASGLKGSSGRESISDKMHRRMRSESAATKSQRGIPEEEVATPRPMTPVDGLPGSPMSGSQSTAWASAAEKLDPMMSKSSHLSLATIATVSTTAPRSPTPEEIEAGIEIGKAIAVHVRSRSDATNTVVPPRYSPPPSPPVMRTESRRGGDEDRLKERRRAQSIPPYSGRNRQSVTRKTPRRKDTSFLKISTKKPDDYALPPLDTVYSPMDIITPPSSAGVSPETSSSNQSSDYQHRHSISDSFGHIGARDSAPSTRTASPTPSSTADVSGATIMPSPVGLSTNFNGVPPSVIERLAGETVDPLFPSADDNLVIYFSDEVEKGSNELLERALGDLSASFTIRTPGTCRREEPERRFLPPGFRPHHISTKHESCRSYESIASTETTRWSLNTTSIRGGNTTNGGEQQGSKFPTITITSKKSPLELQNELRGIMRQHFPMPSSPISAADDDDEETRWLQEDDEISALWAPVLSPYSASTSNTEEDAPCSAIDLLIAIGSETTLSSGAEIDLAAQKGEELRHQLISRTEKEVSKRKNASGFPKNRVSRVSLKYLLCTSQALVSRQHPEAASIEKLIVKGGFLLPMIEKYISQNADVRALIIDFDLHMGSQAILELRRHLHRPTYTPEAPDTIPALLKIACVADGATQISAKPPVRKFPRGPLQPTSNNTSNHTTTSPTNQIRIRTSYGQTTTSYTLSGWTPTSPNIPADALRIRRSMRRRKDRNWVPKQRLISLADALLPPLSSVPVGPGFVAAVEMLVSGVAERERLTGFFGEEGDEERGWRSEDRRRKREDRRGGSFLADEEEEDISDEGQEGQGEEEEDESEVDDDRRAVERRRRAKGGSKAFRWLGLV